MRKRSVLGWLAGVGLAGLCLGVVLTVRLDWTSPLKAVEYFKEGEPPPVTAPPVQPAAFFGGFPTSFSELAKRVAPAVVNISTTKTVKRRLPGFRQFGPRDPFFDDFFERFFEEPVQRPQKSLGSGFLINNDGYIITNNHVIEGADEIQVQLTDKRKFDAKVIGSDPKTDLAVIKISAKGLPSAALGDSNKIQVGDWVVAVGNPFGLEQTVTAGIVSAKGRVIGAGPYDDFIQTDASINPGNSGGPLFNLQGEVVGVNTAIVAAGQGIGFAIPINMAKDLVPQLISSGKVTRAWLGVGIQEITPELAKSFNLPDSRGALISNIFPDSPAARGGLLSGDVIVMFDGRPINESHELPAMVAREPVGKEVPLKVLRDGKEIELRVKLGEMEKGEKMAEQATKESSKELGLSVRDMTPEEMSELGLPPQHHGVVIVGVEPGSEADNAGVQRGDVLLSINNVKINNVADYLKTAKGVKKGEIVRLYIRREDASIYLAFTK
jgi:serine protease Do